MKVGRGDCHRCAFREEGSRRGAPVPDRWVAASWAHLPLLVGHLAQARTHKPAIALRTVTEPTEVFLSAVTYCESGMFGKEYRGAEPWRRGCSGAIAYPIR